ncbi:Alpha/Beta hydrolase protein [Xylaria sp. CBS 124048]|nr:Alpha/Beta hydrolase protein [Xylaria sp. CBS 124048]
MSRATDGHEGHEGPKSASSSRYTPVTSTAFEHVKQSEPLSLQSRQNLDNPKSIAIETRFDTSDDVTITTISLPEAYELGVLKDRLGGRVSGHGAGDTKHKTEGVSQDPRDEEGASMGLLADLPLNEHSHLKRSTSSSHTHPLFPPLPSYGPPSLFREIKCWTFRISSFFLGTAFLGVVLLGALSTSIPTICNRIWLRLTFRNPDASRPFYEEELRRSKARREQERAWKRRKPTPNGDDGHECPLSTDGFVPTEGGPDRLVRDIDYYARRVGLDVEEFQVQTEDGFIIELWHVYDPREYARLADADRSYQGSDPSGSKSRRWPEDSTHKRKFPVLLLPGLLQSAGAYCLNDDDSLAFYLCKSGYDVWLGNNRCGFKPKHVLLDYSDPRMWSWDIRQLGMFDLSALTSRVLYETGFEKLGLVCHSQGTTETFVALAKEQRPELGEKLTVFCALAPAAYAGPLIGKMHFKFMRLISPMLFRLMFGIHAFIPIMMWVHSILNARIYGYLGYKVFSFLFEWTDERWDRGLRDRLFQSAPVFISAESMRWWLGKQCFAKHKCILSTKQEWLYEEKEDEEGATGVPLVPLVPLGISSNPQNALDGARESTNRMRQMPRGSSAWYNEQVPPFALWVAGHDNLVDGEKLLRRFERGREPHVKVVHSKVIPEYEHLDVIWAMDAVDQVFREVREVLWKTCDAREKCRVPTGCEFIPAWTPSNKETSKAIDEGERLSSSSL